MSVSYVSFISIYRYLFICIYRSLFILGTCSSSACLRAAEGDSVCLTGLFSYIQVSFDYTYINIFSYPFIGFFST